MEVRGRVAVLGLPNYLQHDVRGPDLGFGWDLAEQVKTEETVVCGAVLSYAGIKETLAPVVVVGDGLDQAGIGHGKERGDICLARLREERQAECYQARPDWEAGPISHAANMPGLRRASTWTFWGVKFSRTVTLG